MPTNEQIHEIIIRHFPTPPQPSDFIDSIVEWERGQALMVVSDVIKLNAPEPRLNVDDHWLYDGDGL